MRPRERRDSGQNDLFKARLDQIVDMGHPAGASGWVRTSSPRSSRRA